MSKTTHPDQLKPGEAYESDELKEAVLQIHKGSELVADADESILEMLRKAKG